MFSQGDFQLLTGSLSANTENAPGQSAAPKPDGRTTLYLQPAPPRASPLTPLPAICANVPPAVNSSRAGCGVPACVWQPTTQLCRCCQGEKMVTAATARLTSVFPVETTEEHFARKLVSRILCQ